jgi:hypothetical protein
MAADGVGLDPAVRERVIGQIHAFEAVLDDADNDRSTDAQDRLREAADDLMRAVAAVILELGKQP